MRASPAMLVLLVAVEGATACGVAVVTEPEGSSASTANSGTAGSDGGFDPGSGGTHEPDDAGVDAYPCDAKPHVVVGWEVRTCCGGYICRGACLDSGAGPLCDCGGVDGGCPKSWTCCDLDFEDSGSVFVCDPLACTSGK